MSSPVFNEAAASFMVPLSLLTINLIAYLYSDDPLMPGINCFLSIYMLGYYFRGESPAPPKRDVGDEKCPQNLEPETPKNETQKRFFARLMFGVVICVVLSVPINYLCMLAGEVYYSYGVPETNYDPPCALFNGQSGTDDIVTYSYQKWENCDVASDLGAIARAITKHVGESGGRVTRTECLELKEGDMHNGYLLIGPSDVFNYLTRCGPEM